MNIEFVGRHVALDDRIRSHAAERVGRLLRNVRECERSRRPYGLRAPDENGLPVSEDLLAGRRALSGRVGSESAHDPVLAKQRSQLRAHLRAVLAVHQPMSRSCASTSIARISSTDSGSMP